MYNLIAAKKDLPKWTIPERMTVKNVKEFFDYLFKNGGDNRYGYLKDKQKFVKMDFTNTIVFGRADKQTRIADLKKYDDGYYYDMPLYDKYLKDSIDAYYAGESKINVNGTMDEIPNFKKLYNEVSDRISDDSEANEIKETIEYMVRNHIGRTLKYDPNNEIDNPPPKKAPRKKNISPKVEMDKEKKPRKPRAKKEPKIPAIMSASSFISPVEREAIKGLQGRLEAGGTITRAIKSKIARKTVKNAAASKAMDTAGDVLAASRINRAIKSRIARKTVAKARMEMMPAPAPVDTQPKPKKERKPRAPRAPRAAKPVYKMSYSAAVKKWNASRGESMYCNPKRGSDEYKAVQALRL